MAGIHLGGFLLGTIIIIAAYFYRNNQDESLKKILSALLRVEKKFPLKTRPRIAVGFGGCMDVVTEGVPVFRELNIEPPESARHHSVVKNVDNMREAFAYFFVHGAAGERYVKDRELFKKFVAVTKTRSRTRTSPGGYALVSASRFASLGCDVLLAAELEQSTLGKLDPAIRLTGKPVKEDDIHLVLEFKTAVHWGQHVSKRANRFIVNNDIHTPYLRPIEQLQEEIISFSPKLLTVGGLQMLDTFPFRVGEKEERIERLGAFLQRTPKNVLKHLELGSYTDDVYFMNLIEKLVPYSDSLGMNEQELDNFHSVLKYGNTSFVANSMPRVATILDAMRDVFRLLDYSGAGNRHKLTRLHLHTLAFQAIMVRKGSPWKHTMAACAKAALMANRHVCGSFKIDPEKSMLFMDESFSVSVEPGSKRIPLQPDRPVSCWHEGEFKICVAPGLVCTDVYQTAGGGDNISAAALVIQI